MSAKADAMAGVKDALAVTYALRPGITAVPIPGDDDAEAWLVIANHGNLTQRISAFIALLRLEVGIEVQLLTEPRELPERVL